MKKIYVDTNIISRLVKKQFSEKKIKDISSIIQLYTENKIELCTSIITEKELSGIPEEYRHPHTVVYYFIKNVPIKPLTIIQSSLILDSIILDSLFKSPMGHEKEDPLLTNLKKVIPIPKNEHKRKAREKDIDHLFHSKKNNCDIFWTEDIKTIFYYRPELLNLEINVMNTSQLKEYLDSL